MKRNGPRGHFPGPNAREREAEHSSSPNDKDQNAWSFTTAIVLWLGQWLTRSFLCDRSNNVGKPWLRGNHRLTQPTRDSCRHLKKMWELNSGKLTAFSCRMKSVVMYILTSFEMPVIESLSSNRASDVIQDKHRPAHLSYRAPRKDGKTLGGWQQRAYQLVSGHATAQEQWKGFQ